MICKHARMATVVAMLQFLLCVALAQSAPKVAPKPLPIISPIFGDNMVLQRGKVNTIWGWSEPGDKIRVEIANKSASGIAGSNRRWEVKIHPRRAGGPYTLRVVGNHQT